jgi:RNase H-fold protein (predicted Holliday junction resolvase)
MKRIISQLNRKLPELLKETVRPAITLMDYQQKTQQATTSIQNLQISAPPSKKELWKPQTIQTKGLS